MGNAMEILSTSRGMVIVNDGISLGHRLVVLRNYIKRCYGDDWVNDSLHWNELEDWLDCALKENDYDLEKAIDYYRGIAPEPKIIDGRCKCGYMPPFCACDN
ncbi:MAG: hypothetical protein WA253_11095 [Gammaproteobacteria bacterium]